ncbi:chemotaxis protein CheA [Desulfohalovibrio reitneri]|uniref:chemotaxis protein CheA n=1 Tax=Desulfohalovibrio reitneri TaxID=1307759 RepID=UPI0004A6CB57|nr:chemotaxis protein CheA [Desulfohalovibrio reitneri]
MSGHRLFAEEGRELLAELEAALLEMEAEPGNEDSVHRIFRVLHTLKGSADMLGLDDVAALANDMETAFDRVRQGELAVERPLIDLTFAFKDRLEEYIAEPAGRLDLEASSRIRRGLERLAEGGGVSSEPPRAERNASAEGDGGAKEYGLELFHVRLRPVGREFALADPATLLEQLAELGEARVAAGVEDVPGLDGLRPAVCFMGWDVILRTGRGEDALADILLFAEDAEAEYRRVDEAEAGEILRRASWTPARLCQGAPTVASGFSASTTEGESPEESGAAGETCAAGFLDLEETGLPEPSTPVAGSVRPEPHEAEARRPAGRPAAKNRGSEEIASIRVAADKLDGMVDLVGQLVIAQVRLSRISEDVRDVRLNAVTEEVERLCDDLRERTLSLRMLPIGTTFNKFRRLVRDLSCELGKEIELKTSGAETELDKTVIEKLGDPLVHLLRNSIDHGIETPGERRAAGKPEMGTIRLHAQQAAGQVRIEISDDGRGIDPDKVLAKAVDRGLVRPEAANGLSVPEILKLIFQPGFSTAESVTSVSGRGVGMDVVLRSLESLKGKVDIDSDLGEGTTITIGLPLTLAIIDGLEVKVGEEHYVIPLSDVEECVELPGVVANGACAKAYDIKGALVPCVHLRGWFELDDEGPPIQQVVLVRHGSERAGLVVDDIIGQRQTVIKGLGRVLRRVRGLSGATIMGDGSMALILDTASLISVAESECRTGR